MTDQSLLLETVGASTILGNRISLAIVEFLNKVRDQPAGFRDLALDFLSICRILTALEESLEAHFRSSQPFPQKAVSEITSVLRNTIDDFAKLQNLLQKFMEYERGGTFAKLQKTWRILFADKDIAKIQGSLQQNKGTLTMTMLLTNINTTPQTTSGGYEYELLVSRLQQQPPNTGFYPPQAQSVPHELEGSQHFQHQDPMYSELDSTSTCATSEGVPTPAGTMSPVSATSYETPIPSISAMSISDRNSEAQSTSAVSPLVQPSQSSENAAPVATEPVPTPLHSASRDIPGNTTAPEQLRSPQSRRRTPKQSGPSSAALQKTLLAAVQGKKTKMVETLLDRGVDPQTEPPALYQAILNRDTPTINLLLEFGADPNCKTKDGYSPLRVCCTDGLEEQTKILLEWEADPDLKGPDFPIMHAVRYPTILRLLLDAGANPHIYKGLMELAVWQNRLDSLELLRDAGVNVNDKHQNVYSPLTTAIRDDRTEAFDFLLANGVDVNMRGEQLPIIRALNKPHFLRALIAAGADWRSSKGIMELATYYHNLECVQILYDAGCPINDPGDYTPLTTSIRDNHREIFDFLLSKGADPNLKGQGLPILRAIYHPEYLSPLIAAGADVKKYGPGILEVAVKHENMDSINTLLAVGCDVNETHRTVYTPLTTAIRIGNVEIIKLLLARGADVNQPGDYNLPLAAAIPHLNLDIINILLDAGADPNKIHENKFALKAAAVNNRMDALKLLLGRGADVNLADTAGTTAMDAAANAGHDEIVMMLLDYQV